MSFSTLYIRGFGTGTMCCGLVWLGHWWSCVLGLIATSAQMCSESHCWRLPGHSPCQGAQESSGMPCAATKAMAAEEEPG